jgi:hypothetical protein
MGSSRAIEAPKITIPLSPEWMRWRIDEARQHAINIATEIWPLISSVRELRQHRAWEVYFSDEPKTWERFCREALNIEPEIINLFDQYEERDRKAREANEPARPHAFMDMKSTKNSFNQ